jgi:hypothetical protein
VEGNTLNKNINLYELGLNEEILKEFNELYRDKGYF